ncbi:MAG: methylated-DNA--[protein]-cysteine S-methyltransferase [Chloroflexota bacterium]
MSKTIRKVYIGNLKSTPLGSIWVAVTERGLISVEIQKTEARFLEILGKRYQAEILFDENRTTLALQQINEYLEDRRSHFEIPIDWSVMTPFQQKALQATYAIPRGEVRTYGQIAASCGNPRAARAVGRAEATNPMPLVIPCHRVVAADQSLHGFSAPGGLDTKAWLLQLENVLD